MISGGGVLRFGQRLGRENLLETWSICKLSRVISGFAAKKESTLNRWPGLPINLFLNSLKA